MSDSQTLLLVVALIYLTDCSIWTSLHGIAFISMTGRRWLWAQPGKWFGNRTAGLVLKPLLPPLGTSFLCQFWPVSISPDGISSDVSNAFNLNWKPEQPAWALSFDKIERVTQDEKMVRVNKRPFCRVTSTRLASRLVQLIRTLRESEREERTERIDQFLNAAFDSESLQQRLADFKWGQAGLRTLSNALFGLIFLITPVTVWQVGWKHTWFYLVLALVLLVVWIVLSFCRIHREHFPEERYHRWTYAAAMLVNPLAAIRANDALARDWLADFHPLAVAHVLCDEPTFRDFARRLLRDTRYPLQPVCTATDPITADIEAWFRAKNLQSMVTFLQNIGEDADDLLAPDAPVDDTCRSYCPRCGCQYILPSGHCAPCGGIPLVAFDNVNE